MPLQRCTVTLKTVSGIAEDSPTNTWWFDDFDGTTLPTIEGVLTTFYNSIRSIYSNAISQNGHEFEWYRQSDSPPRAPTRTTIWNFSAAPSGSPLVAECALCCSFQAAKVSGVPQARRRGRLFIGPLNTGTLDTTGRPTSTARLAINNAAGVLLDASQASTTWKWAVYSRVLNTASDVANGWVDDAYDIQRRRGLKPSTRSTFV